MTCLVGLVTENSVVIGADSRITAGRFIVNTNANKLIEKKDDVVIGICGYVRFADIINSKFEMPPRMEGKTDIQYLQIDFANAIKACLKEFDIVCAEEGIPNMAFSGILLVYRHKLYSVASDYSVIEMPEFYADGSGTDYALGSLETSKAFPGLDPKRRVELALEAACKFNTGCAPPFNIIEKKF